jgi:hypothetical protein
MKPVAAKTRIATEIGSKFGVSQVDTVVDSYFGNDGEVLLVKLCFTLQGSKYAVVVNGEYEYFATLSLAAAAHGF